MQHDEVASYGNAVAMPSNDGERSRCVTVLEKLERLVAKDVPAMGLRGHLHPPAAARIQVGAREDEELPLEADVLEHEGGGPRPSADPATGEAPLGGPGHRDKSERARRGQASRP